MMPILAQAQLDAAPASYVKWFFVCLFAVILIGGIIVGVIVQFRKPSPTELADNPPISVRQAAKRFNHDLAESRHAEVSRRLDGHDSEIDALWNTMRSEDAAIRKENGEKFNAIMMALGEIKGELKGRNK